ncbi:DNA recombination protein RmuC [Endozoicomonas sp. OPT23]|uniref:DNA recombination protein RmuC n=1 Tax=Endozoicomonas sp. OPT23 TaxID=2072845 RepID=UPI00129A6E00|nr:DNA recombination protein RmuC [Endozoicomonas sp. OPT23]MRI32619.1 DNA recombination protein RmuC [Endozoicomonas sp. OPT23]
MDLSTLGIVLVVALISFALGWLVARQKAGNGSQQVEYIAQQQGSKITELTAENNRLVAVREKSQQDIRDLQIIKGKLEALLQNERHRVAERDNQIQLLTDEKLREQETRVLAEKQVRELKVRLDEQQKQNTRSLQQLEENKQAMKEEFGNLANDILDAKSKLVSEQQQERLEHLLKPFKEQLGDFRNKVEEAQKADNEGRAALKQQLETLYSLNQRITDEAGNLAKALKGDKKLQGNWGELQVEKILESSGLIKGQEYEREPNFKDEEGQNKRPDFIVYLPEQKHLIIDSKVSLVDYMAYVSADTEEERAVALKRHIQSIRNHIKSLNEKDYPSLPEVKAPDFVFMFMPIEPAFMVAFQHEQQLFNEAFEKRIVVVTPTTLLATLRTVSNLWTIERQNANARKLADRARQVYDKLRIFVEKMEKLDTQLVNVRATYDDALGTLKHGRGNLISQADQFLTLGVRVKKELPRQTLETADLGSDIALEADQSSSEGSAEKSLEKKTVS